MEFRPLRIAHRGHHTRCVENTLEAFTAAYGLGCDAVEFDVQLSADGVPVVFHDDDLRRLAGRSEPVHALDVRELIRAALRDPDTGAVGHIPTLVDFLLQFGTRPFYLEIKVPRDKAGDPGYWRSLTEKVCETVADLPPHPLAFVASFHLEAARHALGDLGFRRTAAIHEKPGTLRQALSAPPSDPLSRRTFDSVSMPLYREAAAAGLKLEPEKTLLWNVAGRDFRAARAAGVAGVVADDVPGMLREYQNNA